MMKAARQVLFNHIPKTGGITLRIILNRVYGEQNIFLIKSTDIGGSLDQFRSFSASERERFAVIAGHGAELFSPMARDPFRVTILREPVSLFLSQYYFLKQNPNSAFYHDVNRLKSPDEYLDFALEKGQDNLMTRYLSDSVLFLADPKVSVPDLRKSGVALLDQALKALEEYNVIIDLADFNAGVFGLAEKLGWKKIPVYRPSNRNRHNPGLASVSKATTDRLHETLQWDISLYEAFKKKKLAAGIHIEKSSTAYKIFQLRQTAIGYLSRVLR